MRTCPACHRRTKRWNEPTLSQSGFLDQAIYCDCGWCGVDSVVLTEDEIKEFLEKVKPKQLRLFV